ncbi:MAG: 1-(5-phosphoribosyl)-5-[(5-phosphoribosylamino)methylideneamino]imidazole-4-carboxamide isomerase [Chloroflexi bacterium]|nr:1-(5-phosphoribosyl)-5-[(5-phosphoribosylamino)methylideneamino]imidazole-4-carboxamide isomerase [Chloroflexota bacterium]MDA1219111.1 1-(5-phosphoribosyl)-5-[(5-phosphoribosylamino)methylideneamino]imidazole-4-carboxamide isomerase [Chloroflexota bacterium]
MEVIPSIDIKSGRCVRLYQGDYQQETVYSEDPLAVAVAWEEQGAPRLHLVDLDGAANGTPANFEIISAIVSQLKIPVQVGGGIRDLATTETLISAGVDRVVIGTAAVEQPALVQELCEKYGKQRVVVALDARNGQVAIKGWTENTSVSALQLVKDMTAIGVERLLYTDISRDGTLAGPNFSANAILVQNTAMRVQASGGIASLKHIERLTGIGVEAVILGRALYTGDIKLAEAIASAQGMTKE